MHGCSPEQNKSYFDHRLLSIILIHEMDGVAVYCLMASPVIHDFPRGPHGHRSVLRKPPQETFGVVRHLQTFMRILSAPACDSNFHDQRFRFSL